MKGVETASSLFQPARVSRMLSLVDQMLLAMSHFHCIASSIQAPGARSTSIRRSIPLRQLSPVPLTG